ncbi:hypothetical protein B0H11DRAFT_2247122 [Mycena galericulata]|nr:hypothetical protein B0H11DRAFT_2247122 [Mycena galericulata]
MPLKTAGARNRRTWLRGDAYRAAQDTGFAVTTYILPPHFSCRTILFLSASLSSTPLPNATLTHVRARTHATQSSFLRARVTDPIRARRYFLEEPHATERAGLQGKCLLCGGGSRDDARREEARRDALDVFIRNRCCTPAPVLQTGDTIQPVTRVSRLFVHELRKYTDGYSCLVSLLRTRTPSPSSSSPPLKSLPAYMRSLLVLFLFSPSHPSSRIHFIPSTPAATLAPTRSTLLSLSRLFLAPRFSVHTTGAGSCALPSLSLPSSEPPRPSPTT